MPSEQELGNELVRMRRTFRTAIIAAALGATVGAGAVITVVGAVFSVIDRPASEARKSDDAKSAQAVGLHRMRGRRTDEPARANAEPPAQANSTETTSAQTAPAAAPPAAASQDPCQDQTWPYFESRCLTRADAFPQQRPDEAAKSPERMPPTIAQSPAGANNATTGIAPPNPAPATPAEAVAVAPKPALEPNPSPETTTPGSPAQTQAGVAPQPQTQPAVGAPPPTAKTPVQEKEHKKAGSRRYEQQKAAKPDGNPKRDHANRPIQDSADQESFSRRSSERETKREEAKGEEAKRESLANSESRDRESRDRWRGDDESAERQSGRDVMHSRSDDAVRSHGPAAVPAGPRAREVVRVPAETDAKGSDQPTTKVTKQRKAARSQAQSRPQVQEVMEEGAEPPSRGRDFFGGFFGRDPD